MPSSIFAKYSPELILGETFPLAIADSKFKITWYNKNFKQYFANIARLKGVTLFKILLSAGIEVDTKSIHNKPIEIFLPKISRYIQIIPLFTNVRQKAPTGYKLELTAREEDKFNYKNLNGSIRLPVVDFRSELQEILTLMVKENSIDTLSNEILIKSSKLASGDFGLIVSFSEGAGKEFKYFDPGGLIFNKSEVEKTVNADFKFITKWLTLNKHSLVAVNEINNLGYNITATLNCKTLVISPCFFDDQLIATLIIGKLENSFSQDELPLLSNLPRFYHL